MGNGPAFVAVVFAAARLGASIIVVSTAWRDSEVRRARVDGTDHVVHDRSGATRDELITDRPVLLLSEVQRDGNGASIPRPQVDLDDIAVMVFSSGTTGLPKAVRHSHRTMYAATRHWVDALGLSSEDRLQNRHAAVPHPRAAQPARSRQ